MTVEERSRRAAKPLPASCIACGAALGGHERCEHCGAACRAGRYQVLRQIAQTPGGRMYLAEDDEGRRVALKELVFSALPGLDRLERFRREARLLRELSDTAIPRFVDSFESGTGVAMRLYLAQEYVEGRSLAEELASHRFDEAEAKTIAEEVLAVLVRLQARRPPVFHRDLKPANLIRRADGGISIVDFGSARDSVQGTLGATVDVGTWGYVPPEQLGGEVDATSDLYALGATLVHLLSRKPPREILAGGGIASLGLGESMRAFVAKLVQPAREDRFADAATALLALQTGTIAEPGAAKARARLPSKTVVSVALAVSLIAGLAVGIIRGEPPAPASGSRSGEVAVRVLTPKTWDESWLADEPERAMTFQEVILAGATSAEELRELITSDQRSSQVGFALASIAKAEEAYHAAHGRYLPLEKATAETWRALGIERPAFAEFYEFSVTDVGGQFSLQAVGNVDGDAFVERLSVKGGEQGFVQYSFDSLNFDYLTEAIHDDPAEGVSPLVRELAVVQRRSRTAARTLEDLLRAQTARRQSTGAYLEFEQLDAELAHKLGVSLPSPAYHRFSASLVEGNLVLVAEGDVDGDAGVDRWTLSEKTGSPNHERWDWRKVTAED